MPLSDERARRLACATTGVNILVSASAGTGKTRLLVDRAIHLVTDPASRVDIDRLLVVTFTDAAAAEMRSRILAGLLERQATAPGDPWLARQIGLLPRAQISTVHAFCLSLVRHNFHRLGLDPALEVIDAQEAELLVHETLGDLLEQRYAAGEAAFLALIDAYGGDRSDEPVRQLALDLLSFVRSQPDPDAWMDRWSSRLASAEFESAGDADPWLREIRRAAATELQYAKLLLDEAADLASQPGGPAAYLPVLAAERRDLASAAERLAGRPESSRLAGWQYCRACLDGLAKTPRLPPARDVDRVASKGAQDRRNKAWKTVAGARDLFGRRSQAELGADLRAASAHVLALVSLVRDLDRAARERRDKAGQLDFADFEHHALRLLCADATVADGDDRAAAEPSEVARELRAHYAAVLVDEYQDINPAQETILRMVSDHNLFCVGDVKQSIYRFRATDPAAFLRMLSRYASDDPDEVGPPPVGAGGISFTLHSNFRSRRSVLSAVNFVFAQLMTQETGELGYGESAMLRQGAGEYETAPDRDAPVELVVIERRPRGGQAGAGTGDQAEAADADGQEGDMAAPGTPVDGSAAGNGEAADADGDGLGAAAELEEIEREADLVGRRILQMVRGGPGGGPEFQVWDRELGCHRPVGFRDIAILLRTVRGRANRYQERLAALGIPVRAELPSGYFTAVEIETAVSLLAVIDNPQQDIPLAAVLRSPVVGLDEWELAEVRLADRRGTFHAAVLSRAAVADDLGAKLTSFLARLDDWRTAARRGPLGDLVWRLLAETGYLSFVAGLPGGGQRVANLMALHDRARQFDRFARQGLARFLRFIDQLRRAKRDLGAVSDAGLGRDAVSLTSVHKAKGLEYPVVILADLGNGFHRPDQADVLWHRETGIGPRVALRDRGVKYPTVAWRAVHHRQAAEYIAEEMRVLYVAMTRARERLVLTGSVTALDKALDRWRAPAGLGAGDALPASVVTRDGCYLDWICRAVARHPAAGLAFAGASLPAGLAAAPLESEWRATLLRWPADASALAQAVAGPAPAGQAGESGLDADEIVERAAALRPIGEPPIALATQLECRFAWSYPHAWRSAVPAKTSVTELRRLDDQLQAEEAGVVTESGAAAVDDPSGAPWPLPRLGGWGDTRRQLTPALRGTLVHHVLARLPLSPGMDESAVAQAIASAVARGRLPAEAEQLAQADLAGIAWFLGTDLGARVMAGRGTRRELPFTLAIPAGAIAGPLDIALPPAEAAGDEFVLVQGIIDCLLRDRPEAELVEYKTDRLAPGGQAIDMAERYRTQLDLYARAVEAAHGLRVARAHLVLLSPRLVLPIVPNRH